jgi:hypothetical protein
VYASFLDRKRTTCMRLADGIVKSRDKRCSEADQVSVCPLAVLLNLFPRTCFLILLPLTCFCHQRLGRKRLAKLAKLTGPLLLRRTMADKLICASMPPKLEILVFCNPSPLQRDLYLALLRSAETQRAIRENKQVCATEALHCTLLELLRHSTLLKRSGRARRVGRLLSSHVSSNC